MTVKELIDQLSKMDPAASVEIELREPYDDDPATLTESAIEVVAEGNVVSIRELTRTMISDASAPSPFSRLLVLGEAQSARM
jgi:hypothetical protein